MTSTIVLLAALLGGADRIQLLQTTTGPDEARIKIFNDVVAQGVHDLHPQLCPSVDGYTLHTGAESVEFPTHGAVYFAKLYKGTDRVVWNIPMAGQDPREAAEDILYNLRIAATAVEYCGGISKLCPEAFEKLDECAGAARK